MDNTGWWEWLALLTPAQAAVVGTILGSALGFGTLTAGAMLNARLNRSRDDRAADVAKATLLKGLETEIALIRNMLIFQHQQYETWSSSAGSRSTMSPKALVTIYPESITKLTTLPPASLTHIVLFYSAVDEFEYNLRVDGCVFPDHGPIKARTFDFSIDYQPELIARGTVLIKSAETTLATLRTDLKNLVSSLGDPSYLSPPPAP